MKEELYNLNGKSLKLKIVRSDKASAVNRLFNIEVSDTLKRITSKEEFDAVFLHEYAHFTHLWIAIIPLIFIALGVIISKGLLIFSPYFWIAFFILAVLFIPYKICCEALADRYAVKRSRKEIFKKTLIKISEYNKKKEGILDWLNLHILYPAPSIRVWLIDRFDKNPKIRKGLLKKPPKFFRIYLKSIPYLLSFLAALLLGPTLFCLSFYIHEFGHIAYGFFDNLLTKGIIAKFEISNWIDFPLLHFIKLPQQTRIISGHTSLNYAFGGSILVIITSWVLSTYFYRSSKNTNKKYVFLFPVLFMINEIFSNFLCGTDNFMTKPYPICETSSLIHYVIMSVPYLLIIPFFLLLIPHMKKAIDKLIVPKKSSF